MPTYPKISSLNDNCPFFIVSEAMKQLGNIPRFFTVAFHEDIGGFKVQQRGVLSTFRGLLGKLRSCFFANYKPQIGKHVCGSGGSNGTYDPNHGLKTGKRIETELAAYLTGQASISILTPQTQHVIHFLKKHSIEVIAMQLPIYTESMGRWASAIDLLVRNSDDGSVMVVDLKYTSRPEMYHFGTGNMTNTPLKFMSNSPMNQHQLQVLMYERLLRTEYGLNARDSFVLNVTDDECRVFYVSDEMRKKETAIVLQMMTSDTKQTQAKYKKHRKSTAKTHDPPKLSAQKKRVSKAKDTKKAKTSKIPKALKGTTRKVKAK